MRNYDPNIYDGVHKIKITIQQFGYVGHIFESVSGNCKGKDMLDFDFEDTDGTEESDCNLSFDEDNETFKAVLKNENGDECEVEGTAEDLNEMMVAIEITDFREK